MVPIVKLSPVYVNSDVDELYTEFALHKGKVEGTDDFEFDPWAETNDMAIYDTINAMIKDYDIQAANPKVSDDKFAQQMAIVDCYGESLRGVRATNLQWDEKGGSVSSLTNVEPAAAVLSSFLSEKLSDTNTTIHAWVSDANILGTVAVSNVDVVSTGSNLLPVAKKVSNCTFPTFVKSLDSDGGKAILVIDNLLVKHDKQLNKRWITVDDNLNVIAAQLLLLRRVMRGGPSAERFPIDQAPRAIFWRTVYPHDKASFNAFNEMITRMDAYYHVRYVPPSKPHEAQFTLCCYRRSTIETSKFIHTDDNKGHKRKLNFVLMFVNNYRRYHGIIYRQLIHRHVITTLTAKIVRSIYNRQLFELDINRYEFKPDFLQFQYQQSNFSDLVKNAASELVMNVVGFSHSATKNKGRRKAETQLLQRTMASMVNDANSFFHNYNDNF